MEKEAASQANKARVANATIVQLQSAFLYAIKHVKPSKLVTLRGQQAEGLTAKNIETVFPLKTVRGELGACCWRTLGCETLPRSRVGRA